jgi:hypothetical protein
MASARLDVHLLTQPGGDPDGDLAPALGRVIERHRGRHGRDPAGVIVHPSKGEAVRAALATLGLGVSVEVSGGPLAWEVWTRDGESDRPPPSLLARVEAAQPMTSERARQLVLELEALC